MHIPIPHANWRARFTAAAIVAWLFLLAAPGIAAQAEPSGSPQVIFTVHYTGGHRPIEVTRVLLDGKPIPLDVAIPVPNQWVNRLAIEVKNISVKEIAFGQVIVNFPETGTGSSDRPIFSTGAVLGREPISAFRMRDGSTHPVPPSVLRRPEIAVASGEIMQFSLEGDLTSQGEAERRAGRAIERVTIMPHEFFFADGTKWESGRYLAPDPPPIMWKQLDPDLYLKAQE